MVSSSPSQATLMLDVGGVSIQSSLAATDVSTCSRPVRWKSACASRFGRWCVRSGGAKYAYTRRPSSLDRDPSPRPCA